VGLLIALAKGIHLCLPGSSFFSLGVVVTKFEQQIQLRVP
jgi:uncharacterized membrane protein